MSIRPLVQCRIEQDKKEEILKTGTDLSVWLREAIDEKLARDAKPARRKATSLTRTPAAANASPMAKRIHGAVDRCAHRTASVCDECAKAAS